ncbi:MAG: putative Ig domain-containing protein, partial [Nitrospira sp.]
VSGTVNQAYTVPLVTSGATGALSWTVVSGALPVGVTLSPSGLLSGTPTTQGTSTFTIRVQDSGNPQQSAQKQFTLTVNAVTPLGGSLTVTNAPAHVGGTFVAAPSSSVSDNPFGNVLRARFGEAAVNHFESLIVGVDPTSGFVTVSFQTLDSLATNMWVCETPTGSIPTDCQGVTFDRAAGLVTFANTVVSPLVGLGPITLNGTLTFPPL